MNKKRKLTTLMAHAALVSLLCAKPLSAAPFSCPSSSITYLGVGNGGFVTVNLGYGVIYICSLNTTNSNIPPDTCRAWYSTLLSQSLSNKTVQLYFDNVDSSNAGLDGTKCSAAYFNPGGNWAAHYPYFFQSTP